MKKNGKGTAGIQCIAIGEYRVFWDAFYRSFRENFLPESEKRFYLFTDTPEEFEQKEDLVLIKTEKLPWPLPTLLRFHYFLRIEKELQEHSHLAFFNINLICNRPVPGRKVLPRAEKGEEMTYVRHPWWRKKKDKNLPYERSEASLACVPKGQEGTYVMGALIIGERSAFLKMSRVLRERIETDLKHNVIARWHDESHLNRYMLDTGHCRLLSPSYMYPEKWIKEGEGARKNIITYLRKSNYIDIKSIKGRVY